MLFLLKCHSCVIFKMSTKNRSGLNIAVCTSRGLFYKSHGVEDGVVVKNLVIKGLRATTQMCRAHRFGRSPSPARLSISQKFCKVK